MIIISYSKFVKEELNVFFFFFLKKKMKVLIRQNELHNNYNRASMFLVEENRG